jgi:hypothetical protein
MVLMEIKMNINDRRIISARRQVWQGEYLGWPLYAESWRQTLAKLEATYATPSLSLKNKARDEAYAATITLHNLPRNQK